ncbi:MAG: phosphoribosylformylglycinamidine synthase subunit PurS [Bacteroidetes bacterium]|nr:phosphoribosylformylglycinamidine synthase subunit PurS [Bacteroidota bacterium]
MYKAKITVVLRPSILDVQGKAVQHAVHSLGYDSVDQIRIGKFVEVMINAPDEETARREVKEICQKILANPVMENFEFTLEKVSA